MKSFRLLMQQVCQWRRFSDLKPLLKFLNPMPLPVIAMTKHRIWSFSQMFMRRLLLQCKLSRLGFFWMKPVITKRKCRKKNLPRSRVLLLLVVLLLTSLIGHRFYNEPRLAVDTIAPITLTAPDSAKVKDVETTEANRMAARTGAIPVLMHDQSVNQEIYDGLHRLLDEGDLLRQKAGAFPYIATSTLSTSTQLYLRQVGDTEWQSVLTAVEGRSRQPSSTKFLSSASGLAINPNTGGASKQLAIIELQSYRRSNSTEDFAALKQLIGRSRERYAIAISALASPSLNEPNSFYDIALFALTDGEWEATKTAVRQALERILTQGISPGLPDSLLENAVKSQVSIDTPPVALHLATRLIMRVTKPNLIQDPVQTRLRAEQAAEAVPPEIVEIRRGEIIAWEGEKISQADFVLLDYFGMSGRRINWLRLIGFATWILGAIAIFLLVERRFHFGLRHRDYVLVVLLVATTPLMLMLQTGITSLPLIGLLVGSFYGSALGMTTIALLGITLPIGMEVGWNHLLASVVSSLLGTCVAGRLRSREELARLGFAVGIVQGCVYLLVSLILSAPGPAWYSLPKAAAIQGAIGLAWSIVALGISPYLEQFFDLVTPIRLAELSNPNRPLLKRLASEAPGTFQHTLFVASLAEAAARSLGCNVELVRAGTLYHDIGKMHDSLGFIENQMGGPNKHDEINDPWKSAAIIKKHVTEGLVMARKCRLPKSIQAFIPEHQGTMLIAYFFHEAQKRAQEDPTLNVNEADFRYDGPTPQSRETGIVMLADSCEAALRSLKDTTPEEALAMVNRILRARWQDGQLEDSGLTREEMSRIAEIFVRVWQQFNHQRIAYPKIASTPQPTPVGSSS
jgi:hypothetical protein